MLDSLRRILLVLREDSQVTRILLASIGAALVAGTFPEILKLLPGGNGTLITTLIVGFLVLSISWISIHGRIGVGIAIFLKPDPAAPWSEEELMQHSKEAREGHISFFYVNVDDLHPNLLGSARVELAQRVIESRLKEESDKKSSSISFYLTCNLKSAYRLGQQIFNAGAQLRIKQFKSILVHQVLGPGLRTPLPPLELRGTPTGPELVTVSYALSSLVNRRIQDFAANSSLTVNRHALIINISRQPTMTSEALAAAAGIQSPNGRYAIGAADICSSALVVESVTPTFPNEPDAYSELLRLITQDWALYLATKSSSHASAAEGRIFISAPNSLAFALGALLPETTKVVEYA